MEPSEPLLQVKASEPAVPAPLGPAAPPPWMFGLLVLPYAVYSNGFLNTVVGSLLGAEHVPLDETANIIALLILPASLYFLWSPLADFFVRRRTWVALASALAGALLTAGLQFGHIAGAAPRTLLLLGSAVVMLTSCGVGGLMAAVVPPALKTRAAGYFNAGSLGFGALAGGGLLLLSQRLPHGRFGVVCGLLVALPGLLALLIAEPALERRSDSLWDVLTRIGREFRATFLHWRALPLLLMLCSPLGSGAALGLMPRMAPAYGVSVSGVALINGLLGGLLSALGALLVGYLKLPADLRPMYALAGLVNALTLGILLLGTPRPATFYLAATLFSLTVGGCYALFTALTLQLLGVEGKTKSSRYAIALSLGNAPIAYMTALDGLGARWFGLKGMPGADMVISGAVALLFLVWFRLWRPTNPAANRV